MLRKSLVTLAVSASLGLLQPTFADNSTGSIHGKAEAGKVITIKNKQTGFERQITVGNDGRFQLRQLPTGDYSVSDGAAQYDITVALGTGVPVNFNGATEVIEVRSRVLAIDTSSVESTSVFTAAQLDELPIARNMTSVALLAPGTVQGDAGFGNLASFGGASVAENGYFINGFDVTNIRNFVAFADLPYDAVSQQQVKTGGYGAEYGRSLGGIVNIVTKRGSNKWDFGGAVYYTPDSLREARSDTVTLDPEADYKQRYAYYRSAHTYDYLSYNAYASGPIIQDKLFFFGLIEGRKNEINTFGSTTSARYEYESPLGLLKLDWNITDSHLLEMTYIKNEQDEDTLKFSNDEGVFYGTEHGTAGSPFTIRDGGDVKIFNYTGFLTDNFTVSALYGKMKNTADAKIPAEGPGADCPLVYDRRETPNSSQRIGCWGKDIDQYYQFDPLVGPEKDIRESVRLSAEWSLGDHNIKFGYDEEEFTSSKRGNNYSGGHYWRWHMGTGRAVRGVVVPEGQAYIRHLTRTVASGSYEVQNTAFHLTDEWQVTDSLLLSLGIRAEGFENFNSEGVSFVKGDTKYAPRLGASWDIDGDGTKKLFSTLGRYYIPIASNTNIRASGIEYSTEEYFLVDNADEDPVTAAPTKLGAKLGETSYNGDANAPDPRTVAATNLSPMYQDELIIGYQQEVGDWSLGIKGITRKIKDGMDDYCSHQAFINWAEDNGHDDFDYHSMADCIMINPGKDLSLAMDLENNGKLTEVTIPKSYFGLDTYQRKYTAIEFSWEKAMADNWMLQGSYTWAKSEGNAEGYVNSTLEQDDAGLTQDIDNHLFQHGAYGPLPNDRRHTVKLFGAYKVSDELTISANFLLQSGRPVSCNGFIPLEQFKDELGVDYSGLAGYGASSYYCDGELTQRGDYGRTPWLKMVDMGVRYRPDWADGLTLQLDVRNIFNFQGVTEYNEKGEIGSGSAPEVNTNFLAPVGYQTPRRVSISARYNF